MAENPTPEEIRRATFRVVFRGFDQSEVNAYLERLAEAVDHLSDERDRLAERLGEFAERDLQSEFESVGREVTAVLEAARAAAESLRERASADASRWRSEAMAEVETLRREALADSESMRSDAWTTGTQLLEQVQAEIERQRGEVEQVSLAIRGEAEREAHRLTASARREAEEVLRAAKMESERMVGQARLEHDEIIASAHRQAESAQERARALEERRHELMDELESVRAALTSVEGELEERRHGIGLSEPPDLPDRMVIAGESGPEVTDWEDGATVRVIRPGRDEESDHEATTHSADDDTADADRLAEEVARMRDRGPEEVAEPPAEEPEPAEIEPEPMPEPEPGEETLEQPDGEEAPEEEPEAETAHPGMTHAQGEPDVETGTTDDLSELFRRLRQPGDPAPDAEQVGEAGADDLRDAGASSSNGSASHLPEGVDPFETRERLLLPITNSTLRAVKRGLADVQNQALESLRVNQGEWTPDREELAGSFREDLETLADQATQAGVEAAVEMGMTGLGSLNPEPPAAEDVGDALIEALGSALQAAGSGARERQAAVSRVFRGWRTDEAERRIRAMALASYHAALRQALESQAREWQWVPAGRLCPACRQAAENHATVPPAHRDCQCTIVPA